MLDIPGLGELLIGASSIAFVAAVILKMMWSRRPDPKMTFLLSLMEDLPKDPNDGNPNSGDREDAEPEEAPGTFHRRKPSEGGGV